MAHPDKEVSAGQATCDFALTIAIVRPRKHGHLCPPSTPRSLDHPSTGSPRRAGPVGTSPLFPKFILRDPQVVGEEGPIRRGLQTLGGGGGRVRKAVTEACGPDLGRLGPGGGSCGSGLGG